MIWLAGKRTGWSQDENAKLADNGGPVHVTSSPDCAKVRVRTKTSKTEKRSFDAVEFEMTEEGTYLQILRSTA